MIRRAEYNCCPVGAHRVFFYVTKVKPNISFNNPSEKSLDRAFIVLNKKVQKTHTMHHDVSEMLRRQQCTFAKCLQVHCRCDSTTRLGRGLAPPT